MNMRILSIAAKWLVGLVVYAAVSIALSRALVFGMQSWARLIGASRGDILEIALYLRPILLINCIFWGALYASALAKPACFGRTPWILKHLAWSYSLGFISCVLPIRILLFNYPHFLSTSATSALIFAGFSFSILCFVAAIGAWVRVAFSTNKPSLAL